VRHVMAGFMGLDVHPDVEEGLAALGDLDIRMVTLSNGSTEVAKALLERAGLGHLLERLLSVDDAPAWKPAAVAYRHALTICNVDAADAMLVASHPWDIDGAARAGLRTAWLNRTGAGYPDYFEPPEIDVSSLVRLATALR
jgi:2-haloacid dehalogenase